MKNFTALTVEENKENLMPSDMNLECTQDEILDSLVQTMCYKKLGKLFNPYHIVKSNFKLPKIIKIELSYIPKGSGLGDYPHKLGGLK